MSFSFSLYIFILIQAAELLTRVVVPCEEFSGDAFYKLAKDIIKKASEQNNQVVYQDIPGMYYQKVIDPTEFELISLPKGIQVIRHDSIIASF